MNLEPRHHWVSDTVNPLSFLKMGIFESMVGRLVIVRLLLRNLANY